MKKYNKMIILSIALFGVILFLGNLLFNRIAFNNINKGYMVEVNRAYASINEKDNYDDIDLSGYHYMTDIEFLLADASPSEIQNFYQVKDENHIIKPIFKNRKVTSYVKFDYQTEWKSEQKEIQLLMNVGFIMMYLFILITLIYIKYSILKPFNSMKDMPYELSKGHLTKGMKENKNKFFGRFIWGLNILKENLEENKAKQLQLEKEKKTLVLTISHDIKTPLSAIKLYAKALSMNLYDGGEKRIEIAQSIDEKTDEIEGFVNDIIKTSKEDFLDIDVKNSEFYLQNLIERLNAYYREKLNLIKTDFMIDDYENVILYGDIEKCLEALENIIENAIKYGDGKNIAIHFTREEDCQLLTVSNSGNTLKANEIVHIFESFWQGSNAENKKGNGLGLYICRQILVRMKGDIFAQIDQNMMNVTVVLKML